MRKNVFMLRIAVAVAGLVGATVVSAEKGPPWKASELETQETRVPEPEANRGIALHAESAVAAKRTIGSEEAYALSLAAGRLLNQAERARTAAVREESSREEVMQHLEKALELADLIKKSAPSYEVRTTITAGEKTYTETAVRKDLTIPIADDLDLTSVLQPVIREKKAGSRGGPAVAASETELRYTSAELDVEEAERHLKRAHKAAKSRKTAMIEEALSSVLASVVFEFVARDVPLVRARQNISVAKRYLLSGRESDAETALQTASAALQEYKQAVSAEYFAKRVQELQTDLAEVAVADEDTQQQYDRLSELDRRLGDLIPRS